ncbi:hypothetical protein WMY93_018578 [Mugilogobius chulae]|uniref:Vacuolar protein sorting-associated protein 8 homolog n=1 Tax=Mugilogobius chulae TaxID=88201 RepID=A0AAW0NWI1_9GOBI
MSEGADSALSVAQLKDMDVDTLEEEEAPFVLEDTCLLNTDNMDAHSCDTSSLASSDSGDPANLKRRKKALDVNASVHGSVLRHSLLKGISAQIVSAADKVDAGLPTAITVAGVIAVGTSHGLALVFDSNQALRLCLGSKSTGSEFGAVSALSINHDCTRLLCGFAKGQITMWDLANGKLLRTITDAGDGMRSCDSRCLFSGSKGEILVIGLKPTLKVWMTFPYSKQSDPSSVPQLAWQFVPVQKIVNPILAFCKGDTVHFLLVKKEESGTIHVIKQKQLQLSCDLISLSWINSRTLCSGGQS